MEGWIKLHRKILNWEWYSNNNVRSLFIHMLLKANHKDNRWQGINVPCGSFITSLDTLSNEVGITTMQIRTALDKLKSTNEITSTSTSKYTHIFITNWNTYQDDNKQNNKPITNKQQTDNKQITTNKNDKNVKNDKNERSNISTKVDTVSYEKFIEAFNKFRNSSFRGNDKARRSFNARIKEGYTAKQILRALINAMDEQFHKDNNFKYLTPEFMCRSDKLERYLNSNN